jgi:hypothetical protein
LPAWFFITLLSINTQRDRLFYINAEEKRRFHL